jgi:hypothetical protein
MSVRVTTFAVAAIAALAVAVAPAFASEPAPPNPSPPPTAPGQPPTPPTPPTSDGAPKKCVDTMRPSSKLAGRAARAGRVTTLKGTTRDLGCAVSGLGKLRTVQVSVAQLKGGRCQFGAKDGKRSLWRKCTPVRWMRATGGVSWNLQLRKPLAAGKYLVRIRATDASRNVERPRSIRLTVR